MYLLSSLMVAGLFLVTEPPAPVGPKQTGSGVPAVFVLPDPGSPVGAASPEPKAFPPWLLQREFDI